MKISKSKNYNNLRFHLQRIYKINNSGILSYFLIDKFTNAKYPTSYIKIFKEELINSRLLTKHEKMYEWRNTMTSKGILICKANNDEQDEKDANYKAAEFKYGPSIKKYIEGALAEKMSIYERIDTKTDFEYVHTNLEELENRMKERLELSATKDKLNDVILELSDLKSNIETWLLYFMPPDTEKRRDIIQQFKYDRDKCIEALEEEKKSHLKLVPSI